MELTNRRGQRTPLSREAVVQLVEAYAREHMDDPVPVSTLCRLVGLSERGLRNAFYSVRGMSPKRYLVAERLRDVRRALSEQSRKPVTVTNVATRYGFYELGRFAKTYKQAFGEFPSQTLHGMDREPVVDSRGHSHAGTI